SSMITATLGLVTDSVAIAGVCEVIGRDLKTGGIIVAGSNHTAYWYDFDPALGEIGGTIYQNTGGSEVNTIPLVTGLRAVTAMAADELYVYWTERSDSTGQ